MSLSYCYFYRLAEIIEIETENYLKMDPDPFDERHPSRTDPDCKLGQILKLLFRKDNFMNKVFYITNMVVTGQFAIATFVEIVYKS